MTMWSAKVEKGWETLQQNKDGPTTFTNVLKEPDVPKNFPPIGLSSTFLLNSIDRWESAPLTFTDYVNDKDLL